MEQISFIIYDLMGNIIPGSILLYYFYLKFDMQLNWIKSLGEIKETQLLVIMFLLGAYILGYGLNSINRSICKKIYKNYNEIQIENCDWSYEECKKYIKNKSVELYGYQEKYEAKYIFFRNICLISIVISLIESSYIIKIICFIIGIISLIKFVKYWDLCGKNLCQAYKILKSKIV